MCFVVPKNWHEFQHYKDRNPSWIKLHHSMIDNYEYYMLQLASRALAPCYWLLCSEHKDGYLEVNFEKLAFRLRCKPKEIEDSLKDLISLGFFICVDDDASNMLADCKRDASLEERRGYKPETYKPETEERHTTVEKEDFFDDFWKIYPKKSGKEKAKTSWKNLTKKERGEVFNDLPKRIKSDQWKKDNGQYIPNATTYLNQKRWNDEIKKSSSYESQMEEIRNEIYGIESTEPRDITNESEIIASALDSKDI